MRVSRGELLLALAEPRIYGLGKSRLQLVVPMPVACKSQPQIGSAETVRKLRQAASVRFEETLLQIAQLVIEFIQALHPLRDNAPENRSSPSGAALMKIAGAGE
jgi:hypothetical protein